MRRAIPVLLGLLAALPAHAGDHRAAQVVATVGGGLAGQHAGTVIGGVLAGSVVSASLSCAPGDDLCGEGSGLAVAFYGITLGGSAGAVAGATAGAAATHGDWRGVAFASGVTGGASVATMLGGVALTADPTLFDVGTVFAVTGAAGTVVGPVTAGAIAAGVNAPEPTPEPEAATEGPTGSATAPVAPAAAAPGQLSFTLAPVVAPHYRGLALEGRF